MPTLEITRAGLAPQHADATNHYIFSIMLWPVECDARREFQRSCAALRRADAAAAVPGMPADPDLFRELAEIVPLRILENELMPQYHRGLRVSYFYAAACGIATWGQPGIPLSIKRLRDKITEPAHRALHPALDVGDKLLERDLRDFRSVSMLWAAAHVSAAEQLHVFRADRLAEFLALAEWLRTLAFKARTLKGEPLLSPDVDLWRPPSWLKLPSVQLFRIPPRNAL